MTFTLRYFMDESARFRQVMGNKPIMTNADQREAALKGYTHVYLNLQCTDEELERAAITFEANISEFNRRVLFLEVGI